MMHVILASFLIPYKNILHEKHTCIGNRELYSSR